MASDSLCTGKMPVLLLLSLAWWAVPSLRAEIPAEKQIRGSVVAKIESSKEQAMHMPTDVAVDGRGRVFVADGANDRIVQFGVDGKCNKAFTEIGGQKLNRPVGLAIDATDQLWIADRGNHRLLVVSADGLKATSITPMKLDESGEADPTDVAITPDGKRTYIADSNRHRVLVRDNQTFKWKFLGEFGQTLGQFQYPFMICVGAEDHAYVTEAVGARVQSISPDGRWAGQIGKWGVELGQFYRPKGIAADSSGRIFVSDSSLGVVQVFSSRGALQGVLCGSDGKPLRFEHPMGMCFDRQGRLYVVELKANRVAVVSLASEGK